MSLFSSTSRSHLLQRKEATRPKNPPPLQPQGKFGVPPLTRESIKRTRTMNFSDDQYKEFMETEISKIQDWMAAYKSKGRGTEKAFQGRTRLEVRDSADALARWARNRSDVPSFCVALDLYCNMPEKRDSLFDRWVMDPLLKCMWGDMN
ncbi:hypothetical protein [Streptomyces sp. NPDC055709]